MNYVLSGTATRNAAGVMSFTATANPGVGVVEMDVIANFSNGSGALTATKLNAGMHGANLGTWKDFHSNIHDEPNLHTTIDDHDVTFPGVIVAGGVNYDGSEGQGMTFDHSGAPTTHDGFYFTPAGSPSGVVAFWLIRFATVSDGVEDYSNDTFVFSGGNYSIAQYRHLFNGVKHVRCHSEGQGGVQVTYPGGWVIVCLRHNVSAAKGEAFVQRADTLEVLGASQTVHSPASGTLDYILLTDYLRSGATSTGNIQIKLFALRTSDLTWPPYAISVPLPTSAACSQTATNTLTVTWASTCQVFKIERNVNAGGWTTLSATYDSGGSYAYVDNTLGNGQSVQYRVSTVIGSQASEAVSSNTVVVAN